MAQLITTDLGGIPTFDCDGEPTTVGVRWQKWRRAFELMRHRREHYYCIEEV